MNKKLIPILCAVLAFAAVVLGVMLNQEKQAHSADSAALEANVTALNDQVSSLTADVSDRDARIEALNSRVSGLSGELAEAEAALSTAILGDTGAADVTCKGSYTTYDAKALRSRSTVAAEHNGLELTNGQLQVYYWMEVRSFLNSYGQYAALLGLDVSKPLDAQMSGQVTWQQYFLNSALNTWMTQSSLAAEADARGIELSQEQQDQIASLPESLALSAQQSGLETADDMTSASIGAGVTAADYVSYVETVYKAQACLEALRSENQPDDAQTAAWFDSHAEEYAGKGLTRESVCVDVRHILLMPEGADSSTARTQEWPEEAWTASEQKADELLQLWKDGEATEESFAALAAENTQDGGSLATGGLYTGVIPGQMVQAFNDWCFDPARQPGDTGVVKTEYGYHIMYFVGSATRWQSVAAEDCAQDLLNTAIEAIADGSSMTTAWQDILLTNVALS